MKTCIECGVLKAESQMYRLGVSPEPICKACNEMRRPDAEFEAMRVSSNMLEPLKADARARTIAYLTSRFATAD